jgi:predicted dienelactone hydrolase
MALRSAWRAVAIVAVGAVAAAGIVVIAAAREGSDAPLALEPSSTTMTAAAPSTTADEVATTSTDTSAPSTTTAPPSTLAVTPTSFTFVDTSRPTAAHGGVAAAPQRRLPTTVWAPTDGGPYPLVVFGAGFANPASDYADLLTEVASHGFVVAAPDFPLTSPVNTSAMVESDMVNEPADLSFVATQVQASPALAGRVRGGDFATMGHSDGAVDALAAGYESCCVDQRVAAVVSLSGNTTGFRPSTFPAGSPPLLAVHGTADTTNPFANSQAAVARVPASTPAYLLRVLGGSHEGPFTRDSSRPAIAAVVADFLTATLTDDPSALDRMAVDGNVEGVLQLDAR